MPEESIQEVLPVPPGLNPALNLEFPGIATPHLPPWPLYKSEGHPLFPRLWRLLYSSECGGGFNVPGTCLLPYSCQ